MSDWFERYLDGGWIKYMLAMWVGAALQRFTVTPRSDADDAVAFVFGLAMIGLVLGLRWLNNRADAPPSPEEHTAG